MASLRVAFVSVITGLGLLACRASSSDTDPGARGDDGPSEGTADAADATPPPDGAPVSDGRAPEASPSADGGTEADAATVPACLSQVCANHDACCKGTFCNVGVNDALTSGWPGSTCRPCIPNGQPALRAADSVVARTCCSLAASPSGTCL